MHVCQFTSSGKGQREARKRTTVSSPPKVLTLSLKRFCTMASTLLVIWWVGGWWVGGGWCNGFDIDGV